MTFWTFLFFLVLLVVGVVSWITINKIRRESYSPYFLKPIVIFYAFGGAVFLLISILFLIRLSS
ncbi:MAG: hypothetical protein Q8O95_05865 [bacterium]|nr:hypothetical protein [bacterium]